MFSKMSMDIFEDHCWQKIQSFKAQEMAAGADEDAMKEVLKMQTTPKMPDFSVEDADFAKNHAERCGEWAHYTGVIVVVVWLVVVVMLVVVMVVVGSSW